MDVAVLDMNHDWPNVGHDAVVAAVQSVACDLADDLAHAGLRVRAVSFDVRSAGAVPEGPVGRYALYLGTGGPGHIDPHLNDGRDPVAQGIVEDPSWEPRLFALFEQIAASEETAFLGVCHSFGVLCRWLGVARPVVRGPEKGGMSEGVMENALTETARTHPLFAAMRRRLPDHERFRVLDSRLFDLIPNDGAAVKVTPIARETRGVGGEPGDALTMMEVARDPAGAMPRIFAVNHHPEIVDRARLLAMLHAKLERGEITRAWHDTRAARLEASFADRASDAALRLTSEFTFLGPLRFHLTRAVRRAAEGRGVPAPAHEREILRELGVEPAAF